MTSTRRIIRQKNQRNNPIAEITIQKKIDYLENYKNDDLLDAQKIVIKEIIEKAISKFKDLNSIEGNKSLNKIYHLITSFKRNHDIKNLISKISEYL